VDYKYHPTGNIQWAGFDHPSTFLVRLYLSLPQTVRNKQKKIIAEKLAFGLKILYLRIKKS
ncbi:hypothetical protein, partial [uncultured Prevotella sp.]|uniref:hypothetical protein n=1 Tax=uncultured Prevotella sp. TaxID=159272 RepID=UPI00259802B3